MNILKKIFFVDNMLNKDQRRGPIPSTKEVYKLTFDMAWPSALEAVLVALIAAFDMMMVGGLGKEAISAVGICNQPKFICLCPIFATNTAAIVFISRRKGEKRQQDANDFLMIALMCSTLFTLTFCILSYIFCPQILAFAGAQPDYIDLAVTYFRIVLLSLIPYSIGFTMTAAQRGAGYTRISLVTNLTANLVNILFNALLINGLCGFPRLGVKGAAIATAMGNVLSFIIAVVSLLIKDRYLRLSFKPIKDFKNKLKSLMTVFASSFGEQLILRFGFFTYSKVVANLGTAEFAAHQVCNNIMSITFSFGDGLQVANTSLVGQSLGAKRDDMAIIHSRVSMVMGICVAILLSLFITTGHNLIVSCFTSDLEVMELAAIPMFMLGITVLFQIPQVIIVGALRGAGDVKFVTRMMLICVGIIRPFLSYLLVYPVGMGLIGAWIGLIVDQVVRFTYSLFRFRKGEWTQIVV